MNWVRHDEYCIKSDPSGYSITRCHLNGTEKFEVWRGRMHVSTHTDASEARQSAEAHSERFKAGQSTGAAYAV